MARFIILIAGVLAFACSTPERRSPQAFIDIDSLVSEQVRLLTLASAKLEKKAGIGDLQVPVVISPDSGGWSNELAVFRQLELAERPTNRDLYIVSDNDDSRSNLRIRSYVAEGTPVPYIHFYYLRDINDIRRIEAAYSESTPIYTSWRHLILEFEEGNGPNTLRSYSIDGYQKIMMADSVHFLVQAEVIF